ncbi:MAG: lipopolysaccharide biosynthesis protein [Candidatus Nitrosocosmicus sp.]|nr:lipopolysaccharide biosynthesis protein [Candidatus Nitrosocosmicus sp.]
MNEFFDRDSEKKDENQDKNIDGISSHFTSSGILLFLNQLVLAFGNWIFWMLISRFASTVEIGQATTIYSLVVFVTTIIQFGIEYPILKYSLKYRGSILFTTFIIEMGLSLLAIPFIVYFFANFEDNNLGQFEWLAILMVIMTAPGIIAHYLLLSLFKIRTVLIIDIIATVIKFLVGFVLVIYGFGASGILFAFLINVSIVSLCTFAIVLKEMPFRLNFNVFKIVIKDGLINTPSKISRVFVFSLSVILLAVFGVDVSQIGIFYMALTISLIAGGFATNIGLMVIPASIRTERDYASSALRIGLSFTIPLIMILITQSYAILGFIGTSYTVASVDLIILGLSILPSSITIIAISEFNLTNQYKKILFIGLVEIIIFIVTFSILVPNLNILGASLATLVAFLASAIISVIWIKKTSLRYILTSLVSLASGIIIWLAISFIAGNGLIATITNLIVVVLASSAIVFYLNKITIRELISMIRSVAKINNND